MERAESGEWSLVTLGSFCLLICGMKCEIKKKHAVENRNQSVLYLISVNSFACLFMVSVPIQIVQDWVQSEYEFRISLSLKQSVVINSFN